MAEERLLASSAGFRTLSFYYPEECSLWNDLKMAPTLSDQQYIEVLQSIKSGDGRDVHKVACAFRVG